MQGLAAVLGLHFNLLSDAQPAAQVARRYGVASAEGSMRSRSFVLDEDGLTASWMTPASILKLPEPAMVLRALAKLGDAHRLPAGFRR